jgi:aminoglycoside 3-N-acetyltransferase
MNAIISKSEYAKALRAALSHFKDYRAVILHTDMMKIGILDRKGTKEEICAAHLECLQEVFEGRPLIFPTFNYSFTETRVYDVLNDPCQVGALSEYVRQRYPDRRTLTPVFNFVIVNEHNFDTGFHGNPFGHESIYVQAMTKGALVCMLGVGLGNSTFQHVPEEAAGIPYRYKKAFKGKVKTATETFDVVVEQGVLPLDPEVRKLIVYRWDHLQSILEKDGALVSAPLGRGRAVIYDAAGCYKRYRWLLDRNIFYALTPESQEAVLWYLDKLGDRMTVENMEPGWRSD